MAIFALGSRGDHFILCSIHEPSMYKDLTNLEVANEYIVPEELLNKEREQIYHWAPIEFDRNPLEGIQNATKNSYPDLEIYHEYTVATGLRLTRNLAF